MGNIPDYSLVPQTSEKPECLEAYHKGIQKFTERAKRICTDEISFASKGFGSTFLFSWQSFMDDVFDWLNSLEGCNDEEKKSVWLLLQPLVDRKIEPSRLKNIPNHPSWYQFDPRKINNVHTMSVWDAKERFQTEEVSDTVYNILMDLRPMFRYVVIGVLTGSVERYPQGNTIDSNVVTVDRLQKLTDIDKQVLLFVLCNATDRVWQLLRKRGSAESLTLHENAMIQFMRSKEVKDHIRQQRFVCDCSHSDDVRNTLKSQCIAFHDERGEYDVCKDRCANEKEKEKCQPRFE